MVINEENVTPSEESALNATQPSHSAKSLLTVLSLTFGAMAWQAIAEFTDNDDKYVNWTSYSPPLFLARNFFMASADTLVNLLLLILFNKYHAIANERQKIAKQMLCTFVPSLFWQCFADLGFYLGGNASNQGDPITPGRIGTSSVSVGVGNIITQGAMQKITHSENPSALIINTVCAMAFYLALPAPLDFLLSPTGNRNTFSAGMCVFTAAFLMEFGKYVWREKETIKEKTTSCWNNCYSRFFQSEPTNFRKSLLADPVTNYQTIIPEDDSLNSPLEVFSSNT